jgi:hypothetical protein
VKSQASRALAGMRKRLGTPTAALGLAMEPREAA